MFSKIVAVLLLASPLLAQNPIQHVVFIIKENHSYDNLFGRFSALGGNGARVGLCGTTQISLTHSPDAPPDLSHEWSAARVAIDDDKMDGFCNIAGNPSNDAPYTQYYEEDLPNYWTYAKTFALADNMFSSLAGASFANHLYLAAATSNGFITNPYFSTTGLPDNTSWGCDAPSDAVSGRVADPSVSLKVVPQFPCLDTTTLSDLLDAGGWTWRYYAGQEGSSGYLYSIFDSVPHIRNGTQWTTNVAPPENFVTDVLQNNTLANFTWITPRFATSEHPPASLCDGENWTVEQVNAIMQSKFWSSTAIFITWDDWGGYYDHVAPERLDYYGLGIRVPLIIISPYVKTGMVHTQYEFASVLKFAEELFDLPSLTKRDERSADLRDAFDFTQQPLSPLVLQTRACPAGKKLTAEDMNDPDD
jgi:phospholipase C